MYLLSAIFAMKEGGNRRIMFCEWGRQLPEASPEYLRVATIGLCATFLNPL